MSNVIQHSNSPAQMPKADKVTVASRLPAGSQSGNVSVKGSDSSGAPKEKVSLSGVEAKDSRGIPLPKTEHVKVQRWGSGNNDRACLEGILAQAGGYSLNEIYAKGSDGKSLLEKVSAQNGLKDPNLVKPGQSISFIPKEEQALYEARGTTARRDESLKKLAQGPVHTPQGLVKPEDGYRALAEASQQRLGAAYKRLPETARKGVDECLTVVASDWSKVPGNRARFERASADDKLSLQRTWLAQAAQQYALSPEAKGNQSDLIHLKDGARQYLDAQLGLEGEATKRQGGPVKRLNQPAPSHPQCSNSSAQAPGPQAPLPAFINAWGQGLRDYGQRVTDVGNWAQGGVQRAVDSVTAAVDGNLKKEMRWASDHSPTAAFDIAALGAVGASVHFAGGAVKGVAGFATGLVQAGGSLIGASGTAQQYLVNDKVYQQVNQGARQLAQDPSAPFVRLGQQMGESWNRDPAGFLGEMTGYVGATFVTGGMAGAAKVAAADDVVNVTVRTIPRTAAALPASPAPVGLLPAAPVKLLSPSPNPVGLLPPGIG